MSNVLIDEPPRRKTSRHIFNTFKCRHNGPERIARLRSSVNTEAKQRIVEKPTAQTAQQPGIPTQLTKHDVSYAKSQRIILPSVELLLGEVKFPIIVL